MWPGKKKEAGNGYGLSSCAHKWVLYNASPPSFFFFSLSSPYVYYSARASKMLYKILYRDNVEYCKSNWKSLSIYTGIESARSYFWNTYLPTSLFLSISLSLLLLISIENRPDEWVSCRLRILIQVDVHMHPNAYSNSELTETYVFRYTYLIYSLYYFFIFDELIKNKRHFFYQCWNICL